MATLKYIRAIKDSRLLLLGVSEEGESARYTVNQATYEEIGTPSVGDELDGEMMWTIEHTDRLIRAEKKALSILAYADNNKKSLAMKLYRAGFDRETVDTVCEKMVNLGYINESRQLERLVLSEANVKLRGPLKILPALVSKGYKSSDVKEAINALTESGEIDFSRNARLLLEKKLGDEITEDEAKKILYKNGFKIC